MAKRYNIQNFFCIVNGKEYKFEAWTTSTRNGFCHTVTSWDYPVIDTKVSYINRTWEPFRYETVLARMIRKFPKAMQPEMRSQLIDRKASEERAKANDFLASFETLYNGMSEAGKERLAKSGIQIQSESDARAVMGLMALMQG